MADEVVMGLMRAVQDLSTVTVCIPVGKASELIEDKPIWFTIKSYVV